MTEIYHYFKKYGYNTVVMGASFRNSEEIKELAGCDLLTIAPKLLEELQETEGTLSRKLDPESSKKDPIEKITVDKATFDKMHAENKMANDKLKEGIEGFSKGAGGSGEDAGEARERTGEGLVSLTSMLEEAAHLSGLFAFFGSLLTDILELFGVAVLRRDE